MTRKADLTELRARVGNVQSRLQVLRNRVMEIEQVVCPGALQAVVDESRCIGCSICLEACPEGAIVIDRTAHIDPWRCKGCGRCIDECPQAALSLGPTGNAERGKSVRIGRQARTST